MALAFWTQKQDIGPSPRTGLAMANDAAQSRVILFGGDPGGPALSDTWAWDGKLWTQEADTGPSGRYGHAMAYDASRQRIVLFGGGDGAARYHDTWTWDGTDWMQVADTGPAARVGHVMSYDLGTDRVVLFGGTGGGTFFGDTWTWDGTEWTQVQDMGPSARAGAAMALDVISSHPILFGGAGANGTGLGDTWAWDGAVWSDVADTGPDPRVGSSMALDGLGAGSGVVLFGGTNSVDPALAAADRVVYGDTWRWTAGSWTKVQDIGPSARWGHGMAHRTADQRMVVFGGATAFGPAQDAALAAVVLADTWERPFTFIPAQPGPDPTQPGGPQPQPGMVDIASVSVQPGNIANVAGEMIDVSVSLTAPANVDTALDVVIFMESAGSWNPVQPPGFDIPLQTILAGGQGTQFQIVRNGDALQSGNYAVAVAVPGSQYQGGYFTIT